MRNISVKSTKVNEGHCVIISVIHSDSRGYFMETNNKKDMEEAGSTDKVCGVLKVFFDIAVNFRLIYLWSHLTAVAK